MTTRSLLVELLVEELPPKALKTLGESFANHLAEGLRSQGLASDHSVVTPFTTPRRLAVHISAVQAFAADSEQSQKLMPVSVGLNAAGQATPALLKKLASLGLDAAVLPDLQRRPDGKADALFLNSTVTGATLAEGLQTALDATLQQLPIPKLMQYQLTDGWSSVNFVRPAHGLVALHGADVVPCSVLGLTSGRQTLGHRFEARMNPVMLGDADHYARQLEDQGSVIASFAARRGMIGRQLHGAAAKVDLTPLDDAALLDEVTALVERPNVLLCEFEPDFLAVPQECLILTMKANQKYFPLLDASGRLTNRFLVVSNITPEDPSRVIEGNERVVRPRLADARFFFDQDRKRSLESRVPGLDKVVYHNKLGSLGERVRRVRAIASAIGRQLGGEALAQHADRAAMLAKADLLTDMVGEFPELQGVMGGYYAKHDGLSDEVAFAIEDHYKPRFAGDTLPRNSTGLVVALADKLETLAGLFGIGQLPSGDKDPFALRRQALGVIRMLGERLPKLTLDRMLDIAISEPSWPGAFRRLVRNSEGNEAPLRDALLAFFRDRLAVTLREQDYSAAEVEAVLAGNRFWEIGAVAPRLAAVRQFAALSEAESLAGANKRIANILKKSDAPDSQAVDATLLIEPAEAALHQALLDVTPKSQVAFAAGDYAASLQLLAALRTPVDAFFEGVMVNAEQPRLRANRLALLAQLHQAMNQVADLSKLAS
jgi:glycyl-tRNA synthetase beta chain